MSSNLMKTEKGGEQTQYEGEYTDVTAPSRSSGQLGNPVDKTTTDPSKTAEAAQQREARGEQTADNIRYGQAISEGGMSGFTTGQTGEADSTQAGEDDAVRSRKAAGYGGKEDMDRTIGA